MKNLIIGLGEVLWDCLPEGKKLGGAPANFAYHIGQFGFNALAVSAIGKDKLGDETLVSFNEKELKYIMPRIDFPTGTVIVNLDAQGVPSYEIKQNVAWDNIPLTDELRNMALECRAVCWGSLAQRNKISRNTIKTLIGSLPTDCLKIFDINLRQNFYAKDILHDSITCCDILKINDDELEIVKQMFGLDKLSMQDTCRTLLDEFNIKILVLTCGVDGSYVFTQENMSFKETPKIKVADTVGAGDSFTAAFAAAILSGKSIAEAHQLAVDVSAFVCTKNGAMPKLPQELRVRIRN
jgi:fructokinase